MAPQTLAVAPLPTSGVGPLSPAPAAEQAAAVLERLGFPLGLLPLSAVTEGSVDEDSGEFVLELRKAVQRTVHGYQVHYAKKIAGVLKGGSICKLKGVTARRTLVWVYVDTIMPAGGGAGSKGSSDTLHFCVGPLSVPIPASAFD